ncbi:MAG: NlpC/P60 family protein, partial [Erysipelotrichaceae bacterium]|nr:NlpC/P60 family protein [Erysipelotrichaceae bacterium]
DQPVVDQPIVEEPVVNTDKASAIYAAAVAQLGMNQDCTMLVTNSLAAVGISFHGWPENYAALGDWTSNPVPGDIIIYSGHVAIYAGNGMAVHGGWNGYTTEMFSVNCSTALIGYIHVR